MCNVSPVGSALLHGLQYRILRQRYADAGSNSQHECMQPFCQRNRSVWVFSGIDALRLNSVCLTLPQHVRCIWPTFGTTLCIVRHLYCAGSHRAAGQTLRSSSLQGTRLTVPSARAAVTSRRNRLIVKAAQLLGGKKVNKVVLAYSGGLDTSVILTWLKQTYDCEVVTFTADLGQVSHVTDTFCALYLVICMTRFLSQHCGRHPALRACNLTQ